MKGEGKGEATLCIGWTGAASVSQREVDPMCVWEGGEVCGGVRVCLMRGSLVLQVKGFNTL